MAAQLPILVPSANATRAEMLAAILHILRTKRLPPACREFLVSEAARLAG